jgi:hypothetical protein
MKSVKILYNAELEENLVLTRYKLEYENVMAASFELCAGKKERSFKLRLIYIASTSCRALKLVKVKKLYFVNSTQEEETSGNKNNTHERRKNVHTI